MNPQKNIKLDVNNFGQTIGYPVEGHLPKSLPYAKKMTGQYCYLEPLLIKKHVNALYEALCLGQTDDHWTYLPFGPFLSFNEFNLWLEEMALHKMFYVIFDAQDKQAKGVTSFHDIDTTHGVIEVGAVIYSDALKRTRAATEVMYLMMSHVFDDLQYRRYQWRCNALNTASRLAAERLGFQFEGIFRQAHVFKGHNRDTAWYSIIDNEWPALKAKFELWLKPENFDAQGRQLTKLHQSP